jgi:hypothetical protein
MVEKVFKRVEYFKVVKRKRTGLYNYSIHSMCGCQKYTSPPLPLSFPKKKIGKPKEEIRTLNGFEYM